MLRMDLQMPRRCGFLVFALFEKSLAERGFAALGGQMIDAVFVEVPRQRNMHEENETIKAGKTPEA